MPALDQADFDSLILRIRDGDSDAAAELVRLYEPEIRREVRLRLTSAQLRRVLDSVDICQSVFGRFFVKAALGELDFDRPQQLLRLLCQMVRNRVIDHHRRETVRTPEGQRVALESVCSSHGETPGEILQHEELMERITGLMTETEREVSTLRHHGYSWAEIAERVGGTAESVRKSFSRSIDRIADELGIQL
ncbi:MAG: sigma-70 family RNA polymerase sigma factor [Planctomycetaceae bacterium]|nr:sigma-70 family RNA polymerase sigma factor [Planctomycetaceae bacterium]